MDSGRRRRAVLRFETISLCVICEHGTYTRVKHQAYPLLDLICRPRNAHLVVKTTAMIQYSCPSESCLIGIRGFISSYGIYD